MSNDPLESGTPPEEQYASVPDPNNAPANLRREFWIQVLIFNIAVFMLSLGSLLLIFSQKAALSVAVFLVGSLSFLHGYHRYRRVMNQSDRE
ncbi:MAG: hypothetical protein ABEI86_03395 [Halobacteriaceae archaeon]